MFPPKIGREIGLCFIFWAAHQDFQAGGLSCSRFDFRVRNVREADPHGCVVPGVVNATEIHDAPAKPGAEFVQGGVEPFLLLVATGHRVGNCGLE